MTGLWPYGQVLIHWACAKIASAPDVPDDKLVAALDTKLKGRPGMQYAAIAAHAQALGRTSLAASLLDREPCASEQVCMHQQLMRDTRMPSGLPCSSGLWVVTAEARCALFLQYKLI